MSMQLEVRAVAGTLNYEQVASVRLAMSNGQTMILPGHAELMGLAIAGLITVESKTGTVRLASTAGHLHVDGQTVALMVPRAIDLNAAVRSDLQTEYNALPAVVAGEADLLAPTRALLELALAELGKTN